MTNFRLRVFGVTAAAGLAAALLVPGSAAADSCSAGHSCFYDNGNFTNLLWRAPACGSYNLGDSNQFNPPINDRISSVDNNSPSTITYYDWRGFWYELGSTSPYQRTLMGSYDNTIDRVDISC
ncbi:peptidase inhibitor family I36 protein [Amycolatopsis pigmentata]|uniref:Peptidase inhibitor family I36 protein n=1 Tax=Amycolatopsis pigmentata TaxID=450801 RepID=A0ABW5FQ70_9PSEU